MPWVNRPPQSCGLKGREKPRRIEPAPAQNLWRPFRPLGVVVFPPPRASANRPKPDLLSGLDAGTLFTQARIALFTDDYAAGLPAWTQYHQFDLRASRTTANPQLDPRNLYLQIRPGESFSDARVVLPGGAYGYIIDGTSATGSARVLFNLPRASYGVLSVTRIR